MDAQRKLWNERHQELRELLKNPNDHQQAIDLFLSQHALLHANEVSPFATETFADEIWQGLGDAQIRDIPPKFEHSIAWNFWHMARIEDVVLSLLVADDEQILLAGDWLTQLNIGQVDTGNNMSDAAMHELSNTINVEAIWKYRTAVGRHTQAVIGALQPADLKRKVQPIQIQRIWDEKALVPEAEGIADYWSKRTLRELLLMPFTRHNFLHLNEAHQIRANLK